MQSIVVRVERTLHTAELIKGERDIPIIADEHFYEISMGIWEGTDN